MLTEAVMLLIVVGFLVKLFSILAAWRRKGLLALAIRNQKRRVQKPTLAQGASATELGIRYPGAPRKETSQ